jgi:hypothetical protein
LLFLFEVDVVLDGGSLGETVCSLGRLEDVDDEVGVAFGEQGVVDGALEEVW